MHGYGEFYWNDGKKYFGFFKEDKEDKKEDLVFIVNLIQYFILDFGKTAKEMASENISKGKILYIYIT